MMTVLKAKRPTRATDIIVTAVIVTARGHDTYARLSRQGNGYGKIA
jgi:hypothetical protein